MRAVAAVLGVLAVALAGCGADIDLPWDLDHDRLIAIRATPSRILSGETATLDALLGRAGGLPPVEVEPATIEVVSPPSLASAVSRDGDGWIVTAPADLAPARAELMLDADEPVPLQLRLTFPDSPKVGLKIVWLGAHADNPALGPVLVDGVDVTAAAELTVGQEVDVPMSVDFDDTHVVNWLTSCGTMHDFDLARAYLRVEPEDPKSGSLAVVVRDDLGGVVWRVWPITAE